MLAFSLPGSNLTYTFIFCLTFCNTTVFFEELMIFKNLKLDFFFENLKNIQWKEIMFRKLG